MAKEFSLVKRSAISLTKDGVEYIFILASGFYHKNQINAPKAEYHTFGKLFKRSELTKLISEMESDENRLNNWIAFPEIFEDTVFSYMNDHSNATGAKWLRNASTKLLPDFDTFINVVVKGMKKNNRYFNSKMIYFGIDKLVDQNGNHFELTEENILNCQYCKI